MKLVAANAEPMPEFPDQPLIVFDGVCVLCNRFARFVIERDAERVFRFTTAQGELGQALFRHYGLNTTDFETNIAIVDGQAFGELDAVAAVMARLPRPWRWLKFMKLIPEPLSGWLYRRVALNRYRLFGKTEECMVPPTNWQDRFID